MSSSSTVIISGAGPVGLFLACELARSRVSVMIFEKSLSPANPLKQLPFGIRGLSSSTVDILARRNLLKDMEIPKRMQNPFAPPSPAPSPSPSASPLSKSVKQGPGGHFAGIQFHYENISQSSWKNRLSSSLDPILISEMAEMESILTRRAESLGVIIHRGVTVKKVHQDTNGVSVTVDGPSNHHIYDSKWVVGCDGARSVVRKSAGIDFVGTDPEFTGYSLQVTLKDPEKLQKGRVVTSRGMYIQSQPGILALQDYDGGAYHKNHGDDPIPLSHVQNVLHRISETDITISDLHVASTWTDRARQANAYRRGNVLLAGDAAHIHAPLGGQGLNLGLGDAMNLGWKLAATIQNRAPEGLLDTYHTERHPVGAQVLDWSRAQVLLMRPDPHARALNAIVKDLINTKDGATYFAGRVWGIHTKLNLGDDNSLHPLVGMSAPNFQFVNDEKKTETSGLSVCDIMAKHEGKALLLDFDGEGVEDLVSLAKESEGAIQYVKGKVHEGLGVTAALIRPDGIVAWATEGKPNLLQIRNVAKKWTNLK